MITVNGYTSAEIQTRVKVSGAKVRKWAQVYNWSFVKVGPAKVYDTSDVDAFFAARLRRDLMQAAGWTGSAELIWSDTWDIDCPKCEGFAVEKPAKPGQAQSQEWLAGQIEIYCNNCGLMPQKRKE